jgi:hypothetical protein
MKRICLLTLVCVASIGFLSRGLTQGTPTRVITHVIGDVYRAQDNTHNTVFLVTPEDVIMVDPINSEFSEWLKGELNSRFGVPVRHVMYNHWNHASGGAVFSDTAQFVGHANVHDYLTLPPDSTTLRWPC